MLRIQKLQYRHGSSFEAYDLFGKAMTYKKKQSDFHDVVNEQCMSVIVARIVRKVFMEEVRLQLYILKDFGN